MEVTFAKRNVLVTGGAGFIGSNLVLKLLKLRANVIVVDIQLNPHSLIASFKRDPKIKFEFIDIRNKNNLSRVVKKYSPEYVFHLAAKTLVADSYEQPLETIETNIMGTANILEATRFLKSVKAVIVASSDKAYGKLKKGKYLETDALRGDHPYDVSKSAADLLAYSYFKTYGIPVVITRFGNVYGEGDLNFSRIFPGIMKALITKDILEIRSNGRYVRDYLNVQDTVNGYLLLAENIKTIQGEAFNLGSNESLSVLDLILIIEKYLHKKIPYTILNIARNEIPYQSLDYSKIRKKLGWEPKMTIEKSLRQIYTYYRHLLSQDI